MVVVLDVSLLLLLSYNSGHTFPTIMQLTIVFLLFSTIVGLAVAQQSGQICSTITCRTIRCPTIDKSKCVAYGGVYLPNGGYCGCCPTCPRRLYIGDNCAATRNPGAIPLTSVCGPGSLCDYSTNKCAPIFFNPWSNRTWMYELERLVFVRLVISWLLIMMLFIKNYY